MGNKGKDLLNLLLVAGYAGTTLQETNWKYILKSYFELALQTAPRVTRGKANTQGNENPLFQWPHFHPRWPIRLNMFSEFRSFEGEVYFILFFVVINNSTRWKGYTTYNENEKPPSHTPLPPTSSSQKQSALALWILPEIFCANTHTHIIQVICVFFCIRVNKDYKI